MPEDLQFSIRPDGDFVTGSTHLSTQDCDVMQSTETVYRRTVLGMKYVEV